MRFKLIKAKNFAYKTINQTLKSKKSPSTPENIIVRHFSLKIYSISSYGFLTVIIIGTVFFDKLCQFHSKVKKARKIKKDIKTIDKLQVINIQSFDWIMH